MTNNLDKDGTLNVKSSTVGTNESPYEIVMSGSDEDGEKSYGFLLNAVSQIGSNSKYYKDAPTTNEDQVNMDVKGIIDGSGKSSDYILLHQVKNSKEPNFKSTGENDKEKSAKPTIIKP